MPHPSQDRDNHALAAASTLVDALAALEQAKKAVSAALSLIKGEMPAPDIKVSAAVRTTGVQVLHALAGSSEPMTLQDIADAIVAIRRGEDEPKPGGGTRYQEMCRTALGRLVERGVVRRIEPSSKSDRMRFERIE
jgi:hypothetical protein